MASTEPLTLWTVVLVRTSWAAAIPVGLTDWPAQYQAVDSAPGAPTWANGDTGGPPGSGVCAERAATATPISTAATNPSTTQRRWPR
jgi:hypothetical protein